MDQMQPTAAGRYEQLAIQRDPYLRRARHSAKYTIPYLFKEEGHGPASDFEDPHQSVGAQGTNNLSGKLLLTFSPPSRPFWRLRPNAESETQLDQLRDSNPEVVTEIELQLSRVEQMMQSEDARTRSRAKTYEAIRELVVGGNAALVFDKEGTRHYNLSQYVCCRQYDGDILEFITKEKIARINLPVKWHEKYRETGGNGEGGDGKDEVDVYTWYKLNPDKSWSYHQEAGGIEIPDTRGIIGRKRTRPFMVLRWTRVDGEHYGRSFCDDHIGDLRIAEGLSRAIARAASIGAKIVYILSPNSTLRPEDLEQAEDGEFVTGFREDISMLGHEAKAYDLNVARQVLADVIQRLQQAFLMLTSVQRNAERVTAEEFRRLAQELETGLGGPYTVLAEEYQYHKAELLLDRVTHRDPKLIKLPQQIETTLVTGVDALGRNQELMELSASMQVAVNVLGPEVVRYFKPMEVLKRILASNGTRTDNLLKSEEELAQEQQQAQAAALAEKAAAPVAGAVAQGAVNGPQEQ